MMKKIFFYGGIVLVLSGLLLLIFAVINQWGYNTSLFMSVAIMIVGTVSFAIGER